MKKCPEVSDYGYASSPENWKTSLYGYNGTLNKDNNWLYLSDDEWTITRQIERTNMAAYLSYTVFFSLSLVNSIYSGVRPSFYLNSDVEFLSGTGSVNDPYVLSVS